MAAAVQVSNLFAEISLRDNVTGALQGVRGNLQGMEGNLQSAGQSVQQFGRGMSSVGQSLLPVSAVLGAIGYASIGTAASFESSMAEISARTGLVGDDLKEISDLALQMGADTMFSGQQAADAFLELLASGQSTSEAISTLAYVLDLAAASGEDLGFTADALTDIMAAFNLEVSEAARVSDTLSAAAGASSADVASLVQGFANVGPVARTFGVDIETAAATLAVLSENGIKGAEAGTALKSMLLNMNRDTDAVTGAWDRLGTSFFDVEGNARPLPEVLESIKQGLSGMTAEEQAATMRDLAGSYGIVALTALTGGLSIDDMAESMSNQASTAEIAAAKMGTFEGAVDGLGGSVETLQVKAFTPFMKESLQPFVVQVTEAINGVSAWTERNPALTKTIVSLGAGVVVLVGALLILGPIITAIGSALALLSLPLVLGIALVAAYATNFGGLRDAISDTGAAIKDGDLVGTFEGIGQALLSIPRGIAKEILGEDTWQAGIDGWNTVKDSIAALPTALGTALEGMDALDIVSAGLNLGASLLRGIIETLIPGGSTLLAVLSGQIGAADVTALIDSAKKIGGDILTGILDALIGVGQAIIDLISSELGGFSIKDTVSGALTGEVDFGLGNVNPLHRDSGGSGQAGTPYLIGTGAQPELFVPNTAGTFYPSGSYGGGTTTVVLELDGQQIYEVVVGEGGRRNTQGALV